MAILNRIKTSLYRAYYKNISRTKHKIVPFMGAEFVVRPDNYIDRRMWIEGGYERAQLEKMRDAAKDNSFDLFLDIGTNFGLYSCVLGVSGLVEEIHSFECDPRNLNHLYGHLRINDLLETVTVHPFALGDKNEDISFSTAPDNNTGTSSVGRAQEGGKTITVTQKRLDDVLQIKGKKALIKIDVEGHEENVLEGMETFLKENKCFIQMEMWEDNQALADKLNTLGYQKTAQIDLDCYFSNL